MKKARVVLIISFMEIRRAAREQCEPPNATGEFSGPSQDRTTAADAKRNKI